MALTLRDYSGHNVIFNICLQKMLRISNRFMAQMVQMGIINFIECLIPNIMLAASFNNFVVKRDDFIEILENKVSLYAETE